MQKIINKNIKDFHNIIKKFDLKNMQVFMNEGIHTPLNIHGKLTDIDYTFIR